MAKKTFKSKSGKTTDIMHSYGYYKMPYKARKDMAFNKDFLSQLSERDKYLMRGYAQAKVEEVQAYKYNNPGYKRKTRSVQPLTVKSINHYFE